VGAVRSEPPRVMSGRVGPKEGRRRSKVMSVTTSPQRGGIHRGSLGEAHFRGTAGTSRLEGVTLRRLSERIAGCIEISSSEGWSSPVFRQVTGRLRTENEQLEPTTVERFEASG